jgi:thiol-disulfide isomerase/thioredoxin
MSASERERSTRAESDQKDQPSTVSGRRTLGGVQRPGSRYSITVGFFIAAVVVFALFQSIGSESGFGLTDEEADLPLSEFAVPLALGPVVGDANIAQDDCETSELPCPEDERRTPACKIRLERVIRVCDYFDRPLVLSFWLTQSGDCVSQQDVVSRLSERYRGRVSFLSIDIRDSHEDVRELVRERGWRMPVGYDRDGAVASIYEVGACPTFVYAYPGGLLQDASFGELDARELEARVNRLMSESRQRARTDR